MDKSQAAQQFWESFGLPAYDENTVPDNAEYPYITYSTSTGSMDSILQWSASLWYHSNSWKDPELKALEIAEAIGKHGFYKIKIDNGYLWITQGTPFSQRMASESDTVRRIYINLNAEYLTAY